MFSLSLLVSSPLVVLPLIIADDNSGFLHHLSTQSRLLQRSLDPSFNQVYKVSRGPPVEFNAEYFSKLSPYLRRVLGKNDAGEDIVHSKNSMERTEELLSSSIEIDSFEESSEFAEEIDEILRAKAEADWINSMLDVFFSMVPSETAPTEIPTRTTKFRMSDSFEEQFAEYKRRYESRRLASASVTVKDGKEKTKDEEKSTIPVPTTTTPSAPTTSYQETPIKMCGASLLQYIMDNNLCRPNQCAGVTRPPVLAGWKSRSPSISQQTTLISEQCCLNYCLPSLIQAICCDQ